MVVRRIYLPFLIFFAKFCRFFTVLLTFVDKGKEVIKNSKNSARTMDILKFAVKVA